MKLIKIGLLTIGQSPRNDVTQEIKNLFSPRIKILEKGLLDNLDKEKIKKLSPGIDEFPLVSRLKDGTEVKLGEKKITSLLAKAVGYMKEKMQVKAVGILCTHDFQRKEYPIPVIFPFDYIKFTIIQILKSKKTGFVIPLKNQEQMIRKKWKEFKIFTISKSPYKKDKDWIEISKYFKEKKVDAIVLDCIGYTLKDKENLQELIEIPVLLPRIVLPLAINQLF